MIETSDGFALHTGWFDRDAQDALALEILERVARSPLYQPAMPRTGKPLSVKMTNLGPLGWMTDKQGGYRYQSHHPVTDQPWPDIPKTLLALWDAVSGWPDPPQACLVNWYGPDARMGLHVDADEDAKTAPVVSVSLGDSARFRLGGPTRKGATRSLRLNSGDVVVLGGESRRFHHGVDRIYAGSSTVLPPDWRPGRLNLTLRRVT
ncbi:alpha-ketoglutarate-dependent dioxygenase AlkB [Oceanicaulis alexandrii]|uniref:alpha-ketoglutarate-dependent dioxygenase AlkB n=1 Tax=Oceanicaulis alexandrii TaxID=153233 RepID=UPI002352DCD3|nr:alpha-ketoglutarate-dependent dioxygenase AlkB [Oceanicaulis alexandrii]